MTDLPLGVFGKESASITYNVIDFASLVFHCVGKAFHLVGMDPLRLTFLSKYASYVGSDKFLFGLFLIKAAFVH